MAADPHRLDVTGMRCPVPLLLTARCVADLAAGELLEVVGDDPEMLEDVSAWCRESGHRLVRSAQDGVEVRCLVEKSGAP